MNKDNGQVLSLGGGLQSTTLLLMSLHGEIPMPCEAAVFADTGWERAGTYETVEWLTEYAAGFGVKVHTVCAKKRAKTPTGNIRADTVDKNFIHMPVYTANKEGKASIITRQCTKEYKITPTNAFVRNLTNPTVKNPVYLWLGFSVDEATRMKPNRYKTLLHRYPLIEKRITRGGCYHWLKKNGFDTPVKSACIGCPLHNNESWRDLTDEEIADAAVVETAMQNIWENTGLKSKPYLHSSLTPISDKPFAKPEGQLEFDSEGEVCEGNCFT